MKQKNLELPNVFFERMKSLEQVREVDQGLKVAIALICAESIHEAFHCWTHADYLSLKEQILIAYNKKEPE